VVVVFGTAQSVYRSAKGMREEVRFQPQSDFSLLHWWTTQPPVQGAPRAVSKGVRRPGHKADHANPFSAEVNNGGAIPPLTQVFQSLMARDLTLCTFLLTMLLPSALPQVRIEQTLTQPRRVRGFHGGDYEKRRLLKYKTQFAPHRKHITSPLQSPVG
jgi:hypothetical protein